MHDDRVAIDEALVEGRTRNSVARRYGVGRQSLRRHADNHLPLVLAQVTEQLQDRRGLSLLERVENLYERAERILVACEQTGRATQSLGAIRELRAVCELLGRVTGELRDSPSTVINVIGSAEWQQIRGALFAALEEHPAARRAVSGSLLELEAGSA
jgi:transposase-like protein